MPMARVKQTYRTAATMITALVGHQVPINHLSRTPVDRTTASPGKPCNSTAAVHSIRTAALLVMHRTLAMAAPAQARRPFILTQRLAHTTAYSQLPTTWAHKAAPVRLR